MMRGPFFMSLGLHVLAGIAMVWASGAGDGELRPLPSVTNVRLIRPMAMQAVPGNLDKPPAPGKPKVEEPKVEEKPPEPETVEPKLTIPEPEPKKKPVEEEKLATRVEEPVKPKPGGRTSPSPKGAGGKEVESDAGTLRVSGGGFEYDFYLAVVVSKIEQNFRPPPGVKVAKLAIVSFSIQKNGQIAGIQLAETSGNLLVDQTAIRAVRAAGRFPPLPPQYGQQQLDIYFEFVVNPLANR